ncbi:MAG: hypothetical protein WC637_23345 [Victivallales bacterium]
MPEENVNVHHTQKAVVRHCYQDMPNYLIETNAEADTDICAIYFSSNGIDAMCENDEDFERIIVRGNRYEWRKNRVNRARKHIFVRDVFKEFYVEGINNDLNTCDKLFEFLKSEAKDMKVITVGSSSGGYAAILFGVLLKAEAVFSFTGQFSLYHISLQSNPKHDPDHNPLLYRHLNDPGYSKYYHLPTFMLDSSVPIFHLTTDHRLDYMQKELVKSYYNVYMFDIRGDDHVFPCYIFNMGDVINSPLEELKELSEKYRGSTIGKFMFSVRLSGFFETVRCLIKMKLRAVSTER